MFNLSHISKLRQELKTNQFIFLIVFSLINTYLLLFRIIVSGYPTFAFLVWNLFLAWIPYFASLSLKTVKFKNKFSIIYMLFLLGIWLAFLPNAPYILTDLIHLKTRPGIPFWYDLVMLISFAINGLLLALYSLADVHEFLKTKLPNHVTQIFITICLFLTSYGIYLGRIERWNSWNLLTHPHLILKSFVTHFLNGFQISAASILTLFFFIILGLSYLGFSWLRRLGKELRLYLKLRDYD
jgi:uncharacterized membrane protein